MTDMRRGGGRPRLRGVLLALLVIAAVAVGGWALVEGWEWLECLPGGG